MASIDLLDELKLTNYYPQKLSFSEAIKLRGKSHNGCKRQYGLEIVRRLLMFDSSAVISVATEINERLDNTETDTSGQCVSDGARPPEKGIDDTPPTMNAKRPKLHPMDLLVVVMNCCDDFLRQVLVEKMFANKQSIPILLPEAGNGSYTLLLLALRSLAPEVQEQIRKKSSSLTDTLVDVKNPIVSFVRIGDLHISKSKLVNELLRFNSFDTFFHRDCANGYATRLLSFGSIEAAWFQTTTASEDEFNCRFFTVLNLRGDARAYPKQTQFLCQSSTLTVFMVDSLQPFKELYENVLRTVDLSHTKFILYCTSSESPVDDDVTNIELWNESRGHGIIHALKNDWSGGRKMSYVDITNDLRKTISKIFKSEDRRSDQITTYANIILKHKSFVFSLDEDKLDYKIAIAGVNQFVDLVVEQSADCKPVILPLQGKPWEHIGRLDREQRRKPQGKSQDEYFIADNETEKIRQRETQCRSLIRQNVISQTFAQNFHCLNGQTLLHYLNSCRIKLEARSRVITSNIMEEYEKQKRENLSQQSDEDDSEDKLYHTELKIANSAIGLEHFLRELGQMYEAVISEEIRMREELKKATLTPDVIRKFPTIMARLLLMGQTLELMDGDTSNVQITWLKAVLNQVRLMTSNAKVFVLSIIGVQSSGKSTLLNALFGLQFPVSAGRCTKGIYCHLVPVDKENLNMDYDYVLVVDTEGLGSSQFTGNSTFRDNELATFAIGLADATIINMKGENWSEMNSILQIVAHGLIRVRKTKSELELMPRCMFVHQNVPAVDAEEKNRRGQDKQLMVLDKAIKEAGRKEGFTEITKFNQVIKYDLELHSWFFPDLWNGRPPKARISEEYIGKVNQLRQHLMQMMKDNLPNLTISSFFLRMSDLWNAMLHNDFVLCFRNTQEIISNTVLNDRISRQVDSFKNLNKLEQTKSRCSLDSVRSIEELNPEMERQLRDVIAVLENNFTNMMTSLQVVFDEIGLRDAPRKQYENALIEIKKGEVLRIKNYMERAEMILMRKLEYENDQRVKQLRVILVDLEKRTNEVQRDTLNNTEMNEFKKSWLQLIADNNILVDERMKIEERKVKDAIETSIRKWDLKETLQLETVTKDLVKTTLVSDILQVTEHDIVQNESTNQLPSWVMDFVRSKSHIYKAMSILRDAYTKWELQFQNKRDLEFKASYVEEILLEVGQLMGILCKEHEDGAEIDEMSSVLPSGHSFTAEFTIKFLNFACHYVYNRSLENSNGFISVTDPMADIHERYLRSDSFIRQMSVVSNISQQIFSIAKRSFVGNLGELIKAEVCNEDYENPAFKSKRAFLTAILTDLGLKTRDLTLSKRKKQEIFEEFMFYFELAESEPSGNFFLGMILKFLREMLTKENASETDFQTMVKNYMDNVVEKAKNALREAETNCNGCSREYVRIFKQYMNVTGEIYFGISISHSLTDEVLAEIDNLYDDFLNNANSSFDTLVGEDNRAAIRTVLEQIMGCRERCPFCSAPCSQSLQHHAGDHRANHYPTGIRGTVNIWGLFANTQETYDAIEERRGKREKLSLATCQTLVGTRVDLRTKTTMQNKNKWYHRLFNLNCHSFRNYKDLAESEKWDIPYSQDPYASLYGKWFMAQFVEELANYYDALPPKIPEAWKIISWEEAHQKLRFDVLN